MLDYPTRGSVFLFQGTVLIAFVGIIYIITSYLRFRERFSRLPPGPKPHWLYGNKITAKFPWRYYEELGKEYGSMYTLWVGWRPKVVFTTYQAATDVMEKKGGITASRPPNFYVQEVTAGGMRPLFLPYGETWRRTRKAAHNTFNPSQSKTYESVQTKGVVNVLHDIVKNPEAFQNHIRRYTNSLSLHIMYGKRGPTEYDDPIVQGIIYFTKLIAPWVVPGSLWVDYIPWLRYWPPYNAVGKDIHKRELAFYRDCLAKVRDEKDGRDPSFASHCLEHQSELGLTFDEISYRVGALFGAGGDTTWVLGAGALMVAVMAAVQFPRAQALVQEELDAVIGRERHPTFDDWEQLPYTWAFCLEVFRWRPVSAGGFDHESTEDFEYNGYYFPKGTTVVAPHWAVHRDSMAFPDPDNFIPERFLLSREDSTDEWSLDRNARPHKTFGYGRRVCQGQHVADRSLFLNVANVLWAFKLLKKTDKNGNEIDIDTYAFTPHIQSHPVEGMPAKFVPRFQGVLEQINKMTPWT